MPKEFVAWAGRGERHMNNYLIKAVNAEGKSGQHKKPEEEPLTLQGFKKSPPGEKLASKD